MNTALRDEENDKARLRKAQEFVEYCKQKQADAIRARIEADESLKLAIEKREQIFSECEKRAVARRKAGLIEVNPGY